MNRFSLPPEQLDAWATEAVVRAQIGQLPRYIPQLMKANPRSFALQLSLNGQMYSVASKRTLTFPLMSTVKPFLLLYLLCELGAEAVFTRVGMEPSSYPFNSLTQLQSDRRRPRNPMLNSGAIALAALLPGQEAASRCETLRTWLNQYADCQLFLDQQMLASVESLPNLANQALARELAAGGYLKAEAIALDTYNHICCLAGTITDLSRLGMGLVQCPSPLTSEHCRTVKALMTTCGLYQASGRFAVRVGLPAKSGVSGTLLAIVPRQGAIACYSPPLDQDGNSLAGLFLVEQIARTLKLSIFD